MEHLQIYKNKTELLLFATENGSKLFTHYYLISEHYEVSTTSSSIL